MLHILPGIPLGTIHILRHHIFGIFGLPPPYISIFLVLRISKNWHFLILSPPTSADVIYEWSLTNINFSKFGSWGGKININFAVVAFKAKLIKKFDLGVVKEIDFLQMSIWNSMAKSILDMSSTQNWDHWD